MLKEYRSGYDKLSLKKQSLLNRAIKKAVQSKCKQQHAAIIVKGGRVLGIGVNQVHNYLHSTCVTGIEDDAIRNLISTHAEVAAIKQVKKEHLKGATLYVARISPGGNVSYSRPCARCEQIIRSVGIKEIVYS